MKKWIDSLLNKIALSFIKKKYKEGDILWRSIFSSQSKGIVRNPYEVSAWVFGAVNAIARNISRIPYYIYKNVDNSDSLGTANILKDGELVDLFKRPNKLSTWRQHIMGTVISLELNGEAFWILDRSNVSEVPKEIWLVNPTRFEPIWDKGNTKIIGWKYRNKNIELEFSLSEIIFFKYPNPYDDLRGLAPLSAATLGISQDYYAAEFNKKFFEEGAAISGVIEVEDELSPEAYTRLLAAFEERHKGYTKAHRVVLIEGGGKFTPYTPSYRDFEFTSLRRLNKEEILTAFGVNPVIVGDYKDIKCYHPDTYVLTSKGFIKISEVKVGDLVASMDLSTKEVDYYPVSNTYSYFYDGYLYKPANSHFAYGVDFQVTPGHKVVVSDIDDKLSLLPVEKINSSYRYVKYGKFSNKDNPSILVIEDDNGKAIGFPLKSFISILAWYLACGSVTSNKMVRFSIKTPESRNKFRYYCEKFSEYIDQTSQITFVLTDKNITSMILTYITQDKKITRKLLDLDPIYLYHFIYIFSQTDVVEKGDKTALTYSFDEDSVNAFMEMCVKCNIPAFYATVGSQLKTYILKLSFIAPKDTYFDGLEKVPYTGKVYCLEVKPHHNLCIMFNGKVSWSGNSYEGINAAHRAFWVETIVPKAELISDVINYQFMRYLKDGTYRFAFDFNSIEALREDFYRKVDSAERLY
ncbi:MAG: phage portal protein, partial [Elusimicrobiota bacterium]|nr:phage portal protein [Endomicrobiia bacterium]MDW8166539.1 phage portal protein [Elusimicrobiota bacterium]